MYIYIHINIDIDIDINVNKRHTHTHVTYCNSIDIPLPPTIHGSVEKKWKKRFPIRFVSLKLG